jgi:protein-L-isoaspartate O-methyltransferase
VRIGQATRHNRRVPTDKDVLRRTFDDEAELYDRARPRYPDELVADLTELAGIGPGSRVLEIAPGTGVLTVPLAALGCTVTAVELGPRLAEVARRNLAPYPRAEVVVSAFEDWPLPAEPFDAAVCASAAHWFDPVTWVAKIADALRPGGTLATIGVHHVAGGTPGFAEESQECYLRWEPDTTPGFRMPTAAEVPQDASDLEAAGRLGPVTFRRYERDVVYTGAAFTDVHRTYSNIITMPAAAREGLLGCLGQLIDSRYGGQITKRYLFELRAARRRD